MRGKMLGKMSRKVPQKVPRKVSGGRVLGEGAEGEGVVGAEGGVQEGGRERLVVLVARKPAILRCL